MRALPNCTHPSRLRTRNSIELRPGQTRIEETCGKCGATRHYFRDSVVMTMTDFTEWRRSRWWRS
jgi:hypothetical protein